jgi:hypothetical protein
VALPHAFAFADVRRGFTRAVERNPQGVEVIFRFFGELVRGMITGSRPDNERKTAL